MPEAGREALAFGTSLVDGLNDAVIAAWPDGRILYANRAITGLLGWTPEDLIDQPVSTVIPQRFRGAHHHGFDRFVSTRVGHIIGRPVRVPGLTVDGHEHAIELLLSTLEHPHLGLVLVATLRNVDGRVDLERQSAVVHHLLAAFSEPGTEDYLTARVLEALGTSLDMRAVALWQCEADLLSCIEIWTTEGLESTFAAATQDTRLLVGEGLPGTVWAEGKPAWITDLATASNFPRRDAALASGLRSAHAFPVTLSGGVVGVIELFSPAPVDPEPALLDTMAVIGARVGELLARRHAEDELSRALEREQHIAAVLQRSLLPDSLPQVPGLDVGLRFRPGGELVVGGDFYDLFTIPSDCGRTRWAFAIGDVCGTGAEAAAVTSLVRYTVRALARAGLEPSEVLAQVNEELIDRPDARFCTCIVGILDPTDNGFDVRLANGGHPPPLRRAADGGVHEITKRGLIPGIERGVTYPATGCTLGPGDMLITYTDGLTEARGPSGQFGEDRLKALISGLGTASASAAAQTIERGAEDFAPAGINDDLLVLVLRSTPSPAETALLRNTR